MIVDPSGSGESGVYSWQLWRRKGVLGSYQIKKGEVLLHCSVAIYSESFMGTHSTVIKAFPFALFLVVQPFPRVVIGNSL